MAVILEGSLSAHRSMTCLTATPKEQRPWRMGVGKPPREENSGEMCRGFRSPVILGREERGSDDRQDQMELYTNGQFSSDQPR